MTTRNASSTTGARRPAKRRRVMLGWNDEMTRSLLRIMSHPEQNKKYHLHPTRLCKDVAKFFFNDQSRDKAVYAKIDYLKRRYFDVKAKNEAGYTGPVRFEFYDECQKVFDPQLTSSSTSFNAISPSSTTPLPTTAESSAPTQLTRPMMVQNTPCHDSDDNVSSIGSRDNTSVHYYTAEQSDQNQELASPVTSFTTPELTNNENSHSNRNTDHQSGSSSMDEDKEMKVQLQLKMMQHEEKMANLRIRELELILEITKEQEKLSSHHTSTLLRPSIATSIRPSYM